MNESSAQKALLNRSEIWQSLGGGRGLSQCVALPSSPVFGDHVWHMFDSGTRTSWERETKTLAHFNTETGRKGQFKGQRGLRRLFADEENEAPQC